MSHSKPRGRTTTHRFPSWTDASDSSGTPWTPGSKKTRRCSYIRATHRRAVQILPSSRHVVVAVEGIVVAESRHPAFLYETRLPRRTYIPKLDVDMERLEPTATTSQCPYKGTARYWTVMTDDALHPDLAWSYPTPRHSPRTSPAWSPSTTNRSISPSTVSSRPVPRHTSSYPRPPHVHAKREVDMAGCSAPSAAPKASGSSPTPDGSTAVSCRSCTSANSAASRRRRRLPRCQSSAWSRRRAVLRGPTSCSTGNSAAFPREPTRDHSPGERSARGGGHPTRGCGGTFGAAASPSGVPPP